MKYVFTIVTALLALGQIANGEVGSNHGNLYSLLIAVDEYQPQRLRFDNCVSDAKHYSNKLLKHNGPSAIDSLRSIEGYSVDSIFTYELYNKTATLETIIETFQQIARKATREDVFSIFIAGESHDLLNGSSVFIPYTTDSFSRLHFDMDLDKVITLTDLAKLMNQVSCANQLVVAQVGTKKKFAGNLLLELFETNASKAFNNAHNRVILTIESKGVGYTGELGLALYGPVFTYLCSADNPLKAIYETEAYRIQLLRIELLNVSKTRLHCNLYNEKDYTKFISYQTKNARGGNTKKLHSDAVDKKTKPKTYGVFIATDTYAPLSNWYNLTNPLNDAVEISKILEKKYGVEVHDFYNVPFNDLWDGINELIPLIREEDKLIVFVAGHGYFESKTKTAAIVLSDSKAANMDPRLDSYFHFSRLSQLLEGLDCKNIFAIFDVCFGASFSPNADDLPLTNYDKQDVDLTVFEKRMNEGTTRIFLASGKYEVPDYWNNSLDHSPFAAKVIYALNEEKEFITPSKIYGYAKGNATAPEIKQFRGHDENTDFILKVR